MNRFGQFAAGAAVALIGTSAALAAPVQYSQNFDALTSGPINGQDFWGSSASDVVQTNVVVSGKALLVSGGSAGATRGSNGVPQVFSSNPLDNKQTVQFDFRLATDINDFAGTPNIDIQETLQFRGPTANKQFFLVYRGITNGAGAVVQDRIEFRMNGSTLASTDTVAKDTWYSIQAEADFNANTLDGKVSLNGNTFFDPPTQNTFFPDGNINFVGFFADGAPNATFYIDNFATFIPEPGIAMSGALGLLSLAMRRRRSASTR